VGTFFLVLIGPGAVMVDAYSGGAIGHTGVALAFAFVVTAMVYALGHLSGAHINPLPSVPVAAAFAVEWLLSFALMFVIMAVATDERAADGFAGVAVGLTVGFCALTGGPLTGASMNPARSFGPALVGWTWNAHWIYWLAPITAMVTAARLYELLRGASGVRAVPPGLALGVEGPIDGQAADTEQPTVPRR
jgi:glycerol uptake facilitator-like aquaporin